MEERKKGDDAETQSGAVGEESNCLHFVMAKRVMGEGLVIKQTSSIPVFAKKKKGGTTK